MSRSSVALPNGATPEQSSETVQTIAAESTVQKLLDALDDADCRAVLEETDDTALSAKEVSEHCGLPLSTTYRKLDLLAEVGLLEEQTRVRRSGKHTSEYTRTVDSVAVSLGSRGETELRVSRHRNAERPESHSSITEH